AWRVGAVPSRFPVPGPNHPAGAGHLPAPVSEPNTRLDSDLVPAVLRSAGIDVPGHPELASASAIQVEVGVDVVTASLAVGEQVGGEREEMAGVVVHGDSRVQP